MDSLALIAFIFYTAIIVSGAAMAVLSKSLVRALVGLIAVMIATAGMYLLLAAPFVAFMQVLIYVGGVSVLIFFAVMLSRANDDESGPISLKYACNALLCLLLPAVVLSIIIIGHPEKSIRVPKDVGASILGQGMLGTYLLPFELISVVLFAAMAGAVVAVWKKRGLP